MQGARATETSSRAGLLVGKLVAAGPTAADASGPFDLEAAQQFGLGRAAERRRDATTTGKLGRRPQNSSRTVSAARQGNRSTAQAPARPRPGWLAKRTDHKRRSDGQPWPQIACRSRRRSRGVFMGLDTSTQCGQICSPERQFRKRPDCQQLVGLGRSGSHRSDGDGRSRNDRPDQHLGMSGREL